MTQNCQPKALRPATASLVSRLLAPLTDSGLVTCDEYALITGELRQLAKHGVQRPLIPPKLISPQEAAEMLGISYSQFRALEKEGAFPFKRRMLGNKTVRYLNSDILDFMFSASSESYDGGPK